ncbi:hypothetical protein IB239_01890 [Pseudomonas sp. PDM12]|uniref:hypothetical protein n=1 Tax=Pseudomonas sp. PDM12 TaxID=2769260 RepID=UPI00177FCED0|nr:hypothetical protein [Pseudomonas sp. PDM12]MBD9653562.1 hypothetical protein [Pseudomonas sp. PDM12]
MSIWVITFLLLIETLAICSGLSLLAICKNWPIDKSTLTVITCILLGGLGGCTYCLRAVYINYCVKRNWSSDWLPWYVIRPFISLILGGVSYLFISSGLLLLGAKNDPEISQIGILAVAFIAGLNVDRFLAKIEHIGQSAWGVEPSRQNQKEAQQKPTEGKHGD